MLLGSGSMHRAALALALLLLAPPVQAERDVRELAPKTLQVSVGSDHIFGALQVQVAPADLGESSWARWDVDSSGGLSTAELQPLLEVARSGAVAALCIAIGGTQLDFGAWPVRRAGPVGTDLGVDESLLLTVSGRAELALPPGEHAFLLYDVPRTAAGIVPVRLRFVVGTEVVAAAGARSELRGRGRLEAVLSRATPALWGTLRRAP